MYGLKPGIRNINIYNVVFFTQTSRKSWYSRIGNFPVVHGSPVMFFDEFLNLKRARVRTSKHAFTLTLTLRVSLGAISVLLNWSPMVLARNVVVPPSSWLSWSPSWSADRRTMLVYVTINALKNCRDHGGSLKISTVQKVGEGKDDCLLLLNGKTFKTRFSSYPDVAHLALLSPNGRFVAVEGEKRRMVYGSIIVERLTELVLDSSNGKVLCEIPHEMNFQRLVRF